MMNPSNFLKALFSENSGVSSMRVMSMMSLIIGGYIAIHGLDTKADLVGLAALAAVFVSAAFGGKVMQKSIEMRGAPDVLPSIPPPAPRE